MFLTIFSRTNISIFEDKGEESLLYSMYINAHTETHKNEWERITMKITTTQRQTAVS